MQENHPDWFLRGPNGLFVSPGAWGTTWEDLVELDHRNPSSWDYLAEAFLTWCRRGVDGFRCDAGYKVPAPAWQYITACVRRESPETIFLLEGLGGAWEATEDLLTEGGMQWAYSELFQNFSGVQTAGYLDHSLRQSARAGLLVHYSETHDNERLAKRGRAWSLMRNQLCALASVSGGYGFTCGVEWLASEKILVHESRGLAWGGSNNLVPELARLNRLLAEHPCFFDGATLTRLSPLDSMVYALRRDSAEGKDHTLVLVNLDIASPQSIALEKSIYHELGSPKLDLLGRAAPAPRKQSDHQIVFHLAPGACYCLAASVTPLGLAGDEYHRSRAQAAWAIQALGEVLAPEEIGPHDWRALAKMVKRRRDNSWPRWPAWTTAWRAGCWPRWTLPENRRVFASGDLAVAGPKADNFGAAAAVCCCTTRFVFGPRWTGMTAARRIMWNRCRYATAISRAMRLPALNSKVPQG